MSIPTVFDVCGSVAGGACAVACARTDAADMSNSTPTVPHAAVDEYVIMILTSP
jgi:hypothetical protein